MVNSIRNDIANQISDRCIRCYREQEWYAENVLSHFIEETEFNGKRILEIGCAEAGLLKYYKKKGAFCSGLELSDDRFKNAVLLDKDNSLDLFQADICNLKSFDNKIHEKYDLIVIRDVIEHIMDKKTALENIFKLLNPGGKVFMSFPPRYCAYAGHQQTVPNIFGKLPYLHLLPNNLYIKYLKWIGCTEKKITYLIDTKKTRISINEMKSILDIIGYKIIKSSNWIIRPAYSFRFGLPKIKNPFRWLPILDEMFCNGALFLLKRPNS